MVKGKKILYEGKPILAVCHSISGGKTEDDPTYTEVTSLEDLNDLLSGDEPKVYAEIKEALKKGDVVLDGLYSWYEYTYLIEKFEKIAQRQLGIASTVLDQLRLMQFALCVHMPPPICVLLGLLVLL